MKALVEVRRLAMLDPDATETDRHGRRSFRIGGRVFATLPDDRHVHIVLAEDAVSTVVESDPVTYRPLFVDEWLVGLTVVLDTANRDRLGALLELARTHAVQKARHAHTGRQRYPGTSGEDASVPPVPTREEQRRAARAEAMATFRSAAGRGPTAAEIPDRQPTAQASTPTSSQRSVKATTAA